MSLNLSCETIFSRPRPPTIVRLFSPLLLLTLTPSTRCGTPGRWIPSLSCHRPLLAPTSQYQDRSSPLGVPVLILDTRHF
ncbi:hypothetical protein QBC37DRAFT_424236 [Rhypophila decipiens]|uniref:Uncharacterized protein n=1 Tax=Rhypophila decipiens TaxID=261697 RepID=A0AAN6Y7L6_9PEZI|nr:hypothetical protein QBC37DRAFT_424236 [Rhypophila decipiens]